jgi:4-carboxymuconolactone decarboxylase
VVFDDLGMEGRAVMITTARVQPVPEEEWTDEQVAILEPIFARGGTARNIFATLVRTPRLLLRWSKFGGALLYRGSISDREREIVILRTAANCEAEYDWGQHTLHALRVGITDEELHQIGRGGSLTPPRDRLLLALADELHTTSTVSDHLWDSLTSIYTAEQLIEILFLVGQYHTVSYLTNALRIQREPGVPGLIGDSAAG